MKKIGLLTLNYQVNYGGILQLISLYQYLKFLGYDVEVINYKSFQKNSIIRKILLKITNLLWGGSFWNSIKDKIVEKKIPREKNSLELINRNKIYLDCNLKFTEEVNETSIEDIGKNYDVIIVGSDQIWSVTDANKLIYLFDWNYSGEKIAYAACSVKTKPSYLNKRKVKFLLKKFDKITVRDKTTYDFVYNSSKIKPTFVCDPTMLINHKDFIGAPMLNDEYIFVYILGDEIKGSHTSLLEKIKGEIGNYKIVSSVIPNNSIVATKGADLVFDTCTPLEWLNLLYYAKFVVTDSYHGALFSIHYNKDFVAYYKSYKRATRLLDLASQYNLKKNFISNINELSNIEYPIKYEYINEISERLVLNSQSVLQKL